MLLLILVFMPFLAGILLFITGRRNERARDILAVVVCGLALLAAVAAPQVPDPSGALVSISGILTGAISFTLDGFRGVYAVITAFMWFMTALFAQEYFAEERENLNRYWFFMIVTLGATEGVMLSANLITAFIFFEILSFTSFTWVIHEETPDARNAGYTYLFIAVIGGLVLFMGLLLLNSAEGGAPDAVLFFDNPAGRIAGEAALPASRILFAGGICVLIGFGAKAGMFPLHIWLPKAHPIAPSPASALLSGVLTKVGIYGILMVSLLYFRENAAFGTLMLILGLITMALGAVLALFSVNLKRTLACSSMSQIGFILTGAGMMILNGAGGCEEGVVLATCGLMLHMVNHSLIKLVLFTAAGVVVMDAHSLDLNRIRGFGRRKTFLKIAFALGALGISGVPLFNGYISKTLLHEGIVEGIHTFGAYAGLLRTAEWIFLISGGLTFAYMLKLFIALFIEKNEDPARQALYDKEGQGMGIAGIISVFGSSLILPVLGQPYVMTRLAMRMSGYEEILHFKAFSLENLKGGGISLIIGAAVYLLILRRVLMENGTYADRWPSGLDIENRVYRPLLLKILPAIGGFIASLFAENVVLKPLAKLSVILGAFIASLFAENVVLKPLAKLSVILGAFCGRVLETSTDAVIMFFRKTILREKPVVGGKKMHPGLLRTVAEETAEAVQPLVQNFTFAMLMTCVGIVLILAIIMRYSF